MDPMKRAKVNEYYDELLSRLPPPLAARLRDKYEKDERDFIVAAVEACPHADGPDWAKPSCKRCYGRGYKSTVVATGDKITCNCGEKRYMKWMKNFREDYNRKRDNHGTT